MTSDFERRHKDSDALLAHSRVQTERTARAVEKSRRVIEECVAGLELVPAAIGCAWPEFERIAEKNIGHTSALTEMARVIANRLDVDVCSIYLVEDKTGDLVLGATMGLRQSSVGTVRMNPSQGLVGLVAQELQPVLVPDAASHPRFLQFPEAGEEPYDSFFGIPILQSGILRGVLVIQTADTRDLSTDWAGLATAAQRLAPFLHPLNLDAVSEIRSARNGRSK